jgi:hypothetical protein
MTNRNFISFFVVLLLFGCGKSDVDKCVDAQVEDYRQCKAKGIEQWCQSESEVSWKAQMHFACLKMSGQAK